MSLGSNKKYSDHLSKLQEQNGEECEDGAEEIEDSRPKKVYKRNRKKERLRKLIRSHVLPRLDFSTSEFTMSDSITGKSMSVAIFDLTLN